ncbi:MAG: DUF5117 domain-containing protein [Balneolaceae bacterium]|nr:MAG: DUF5117 domain-containing protein [Balneolaceae bacterium]
MLFLPKIGKRIYSRPVLRRVAGMIFCTAVCAVMLASCAHTSAEQTAASPEDRTDRTETRSHWLDIATFTRTFEKQDGFFPIYWDEQRGRLFLEIPEERLGQEFLYLIGTGTGGGMNGPRLDRAQVGDEHLARFEHVGPKIHFILVNHRFVSTDPDKPHLARSVEESFPVSVVGSFDIAAEQDGRFLIDATSYFLTDAFDIRRLFRSSNLGTYRVETARSYIYLPRTKAFPENTEIEAAVTLTSDSPAWTIRRHAPDGRSVTIRQHHSLVKLPDDGFRPRKYDPRGGYLNISFYDYSKGFDEDLITRYAVRHRLEKKDPDAEISEPVKPITYYLDPAIPEPYRTAFREGMEWFNGVFEAAGFRNAFVLKDMPEDMDPMDARYNVVMWVHRSEAGASIGPTFRDPRTGEIIKAAVRMDSHRSLVNFNQYAGFIPALEAGALESSGSGSIESPGAAGGFGSFESPGTANGFGSLHSLGSGDPKGTLEWMATLDPYIDAEEFVMSRRRQHAAHELGHTLGLAHNFAAESMGRASVMDYPGAHVRLRDGRLDLSRAYAPGPGAFDTLSIRWGYTRFDPDEEGAGLEAIIQEGLEKGLYHISAPHTRPFGSHPQVQAWALAEDPTTELKETMEVRRFLMEHFDERAIREGEPLFLLRERFVPIYVMHRFLLTSVTKYIGGMEFRYALRGDGQVPTQIIPAEKQREALQTLLTALHTDELTVPERILGLMAPPPWGYSESDRSFSSPATPAADQLEFVRALSARIFSELLEPPRMARLIAFADRDPDLPTLEEVLHTVTRDVFGPEGGAALSRWMREETRPAIRRIVQRMYVEALIEAAGDTRTVAEARAAANWELGRISRRIDAILKTVSGSATGSARASASKAAAVSQYTLMQEDIRRFLRDGKFEPDIRPYPRMPNMFPLGQ